MRARTTLQTFFWSGACRANFLAPPPLLGPSVTLVGEDAEPGKVTLSVAGVGWGANEPLTITLAGPGWNTQTSPFGPANGLGVSPVFTVPFRDNLPRGEFTFTMKGATETATLAVECSEAGYCTPKFWRRPSERQFDGRYVGTLIATNAGIFVRRPCPQGRLGLVTLVVANSNVTLLYNPNAHLVFSGRVSDDGVVAISGQNDRGDQGMSLSGVIANGEFAGRTSGLACNAEMRLERTSTIPR